MDQTTSEQIIQQNKKQNQTDNRHICNLNFWQNRNSSVVIDYIILSKPTKRATN